MTSFTSSHFIELNNVGVLSESDDDGENVKLLDLDQLSNYVKHHVGNIKRGDIIQTIDDDNRFRNDGMLFWDGNRAISQHLDDNIVVRDFVVSSKQFNPNYWYKEVTPTIYFYLAPEFRQSIVDSLKFDAQHTISPCLNGTFVCQATTYVVLLNDLITAKSEAHSIIMNLDNPFESLINRAPLSSGINLYTDSYNKLKTEKTDSREIYSIVLS